MGAQGVNANSGTSITKKKDLEKYFLSRPPRDTDTFFHFCTSTSHLLHFYLLTYFF